MAVSRPDDPCRAAHDRRGRQDSMVPGGVHIWYGCTPSVDNGMLQADVDDDVRRLMARLAP
ncbi:hypothetical protein [Microbispora catharanthi]|uniref:Uncharacterized protein n=1 Tax=Microbispora catharanthi TaxID=1712871 RepID=A0A5N6B4L6_9ACTN|nr:hypothetical protein [Microbispora catharanthi]KAB8175406.1 hypothetical protein FH610_039640 [Microbispora catharanthi]